jgi:hypothetical protein
MVSEISGTIRGQSVAGPRSIGEVLDRFSITHGVNLLLVNAVMRKWGLVGRLGVGGSIPHAESAAGGVSLERYQWGALSLQESAGAEIRIAGSLYASGEYKLTRTAQNVTIVSGSARTPLVTHHLVLGVAWRLGDRRTNPETVVTKTLTSTANHASICTYPSVMLMIPSTALSALIRCVC